MSSNHIFSLIPQTIITACLEARVACTPASTYHYQQGGKAGRHGKSKKNSLVHIRNVHSFLGVTIQPAFWSPHPNKHSLASSRSNRSQGMGPVLYSSILWRRGQEWLQLAGWPGHHLLRQKPGGALLRLAQAPSVPATHVKEAGFQRWTLGPLPCLGWW